MRRWSLHVLASLLLTVSVLAAASWAYSYRRSHSLVLALRPSGYWLQLFAGQGLAHAQWGIYDTLTLELVPPGRFVLHWSTWPPGRIPHVTFWTSVGFNYYRSKRPPGQRLIVPHWFVLLLTAPLPAWHFRRVLVRRRRLRRGLCPRCGYDLTANATGVCPECGLRTSTSSVESRAQSSRGAVGVPPAAAASPPPDLQELS